MTTRALDRLASQATSHLRRAAQTGDSGEHRRELRLAAEALVEARSHFTSPDGGVDWRGRSWDYRQWAGSVFGQVGSPSEVQRLQASTRYHVSNVLRERLDEETLADLGLLAVSAKDRAARDRASKSELLSSLTGSGLSTRDALLALTAANGLLKRLEPRDLQTLPLEGRKAARGLLSDVSRQADRLAEGLKARRRKPE